MCIRDRYPSALNSPKANGAGFIAGLPLPPVRLRSEVTATPIESESSADLLLSGLYELATVGFLLHAKNEQRRQIWLSSSRQQKLCLEVLNRFRQFCLR